MVKIYKQPFAHDGDTIAIPDTSQPDGKMSSTDGWTPDYQLPKTDPNYKPVGRQEMNGVFKEVTEALGQVQVQGAASWSADGAPHPINAQVYHNGKQWLALRANSVEPIEGADWAAIGTAATYDVGEATGQVMQVGAFGVGHTFSAAVFDANEIADQVGNKSGFYLHVSTIGSANVPYLYVYIQQLFHTDGNLTQIAYGYNIPVVWVRHRYQGVWSPWAKQLSANDILQTTGNSTELPMSQAAISGQLLGVGQDVLDVSGERSRNVIYTAATRAIFVTVSTGAGGQLEVSSDGDNWVSLGQLGSSGDVEGISAIVPHLSMYRVTGSGAIGNWTETSQ